MPTSPHNLGNSLNNDAQSISHILSLTGFGISLCVNDPSAGSPTETLLRLLLPLSDKVH